MFGKYIMTVGACLMMVACASTPGNTSSGMKKSDKSLSCREVQLEINESEFARNKAMKAKAPGFSTVVMPISYINTYMDASSEQKAADERIEYLTRIYDINRCDERVAYEEGDESINRMQSAQAYVPVASPAPQIQPAAYIQTVRGPQLAQTSQVAVPPYDYYYAY